MGAWSSRDGIYFLCVLKQTEESQRCHDDQLQELGIMTQTLIWLVVYLQAKLGTEADYFIIVKFQFQLTVLSLLAYW